MEPHNSKGKVSPAYRNAAITALVWTILLAGSLGWDIHHEKDTTIEIVKGVARAIFNKDQVFRIWATSHGGVYVPPDERTPPNPYLIHTPNRDVTTATGKPLTLMNPAYMLRQVMNDYENLFGVKGHITSLNLINPANTPDEWERQSLLAFHRGDNESFETTDIKGKPYTRLMQPMVTKKGCLKCHGHQGYKVGNIRGGEELPCQGPLT